MKTIKFFKQQGFWYAYLPEFIESGGTLADCEMVAGADSWLDFLSNKGKEITLTLSTEEPLQEKLNLYEKTDNLEDGATYIAHSYKEEDINQIMWLCPVTLFVFGEYPDVIYYNKI